MPRAQILDGKSLARQLRDDYKLRAQKLIAAGLVPRLDVIVAAQDPASLAYVNMKHRWAAELGMIGEAWMVDESTSQSYVLEKIAELNGDPAVHGVLIQHPLPKHLDENAALLALGAEKDVDGITPQSLGRLTAGLPGFRCATPLGIVRLLEHYGVEIQGKRALVIGRSVILGKPAALMLLERNATVTIAHRYTKDLPDLCREADILVAAVGKAELIQGQWLKPGSVVVDAGYNKVPDRSHDVGDVHFDSASEVASWITPVPGGVGPMTVASLLGNCLDAAEASQARQTSV